MSLSSKSDNESVKIFIYSIVLITLSYWLIDFVEMSWQKGLFKILFPDSYDTISFILAIMSGIYFAILIVTLKNDPLKRVQAVSLLSFSIIVTGFYTYYIYKYILVFAFFFVFTYIYANKLEMPSCRYYVKRKSIKRPLSFVFIFTCVFIISTVLNYLGGYYYTSKMLPDETVYYILGAFVFGGVFYKFMDYETKSVSIFVVGPPRVGKTTFIAALCDELNGDPNNELGTTLYDMKKTGWPMFIATDITLFNFLYQKGYLFTKCININTYDYPGGYIRDIFESFKWLEEKKEEVKSHNFEDLVERKINLQTELPNTILNKDATAKIIYKIAMSTKLFFMISAISINRQDPMMVGTSTQFISEYKDYMKVYELIAKVTDKPFVIVVNKVDQEYSAKLRPTTPLNNVARWILEDMKKKSNTFFINQKKVIKRENSYNDDSSLIFPCWIPEENDVLTIKNGKLSTIGYDEIIKVL